MLRSRSIYLLLTVLSAMSFTGACAEQTVQKPAPPPDTRKADEAAIRAASADWSKASQEKDLDKATAYIADDAIFFVNKGAPLKGKDAIKTAWKPMVSAPGPGLPFTTAYVEVARSGDIAYEYGTFDLQAEVKKGKVADENGRYVVVWKKQADGSWKAAVDIDNVGK
jgi:uncharacterized protein (TIGR02246 family)